MSWIDKELKRRAAANKRPPRQSSAIPASERIQELWDKLERANAALPSELQLRAEHGDDTILGSPNESMVGAWLRARNGAALGFAHNAVRYVWPERGRRWSNNFSIRWDVEQERYLLSRRVGTLPPFNVASYPFDDRRIEYMIKRLVIGKRISASAVRKKRLGLF